MNRIDKTIVVMLVSALPLVWYTIDFQLNYFDRYFAGDVGTAPLWVKVPTVFAGICAVYMFYLMSKEPVKIDNRKKSS